jgi:hypothetical protein
MFVADWGMCALWIWACLRCEPAATVADGSCDPHRDSLTLSVLEQAWWQWACLWLMSAVYCSGPAAAG